MKPKELPPLEVLQELFYVESGKLYWRVNKGNRGKKDKEAGYRQKGGYRSVEIDGVPYLTHRIIYCLYHSVLITPDDYIDHKNRDKEDNTEDNLRKVSFSENSYNKSGKNNKHEVTGISYDARHKSRPWRAVIYIERKSKHLGNYSTKEEAVEARLQAEKDLGVFIYRA
jgi:hypothetical protein